MKKCEPSSHCKPCTAASRRRVHSYSLCVSVYACVLQVYHGGALRWCASMESPCRQAYLDHTWGIGAAGRASWDPLVVLAAVRGQGSRSARTVAPVHPPAVPHLCVCTLLTADRE